MLPRTKSTAACSNASSRSSTRRAPMAEHEAAWPLRGHTEIVAGLWRAAAANRLPHALLFQGREGLGKFRAARALAQGLLCASGPRETGPCGTCGACKRFLAD